MSYFKQETGLPSVRRVGFGPPGPVREPVGQGFCRVRGDTAGALPSGLYPDANSTFDASGVYGGPFDDLRTGLVRDEGLPLRHVAVGPSVGQGGGDQFYLLTPDRAGNHVLGRTRVEQTLFGGWRTFDDGVGPENGQTFNPRVMAFDPPGTRLVVLEDQGRLQLLDARVEDRPRRYITKWGRFGSGPGKFSVTPPTAVDIAVNSRGWIYVADGEERVQVFVP